MSQTTRRSAPGAFPSGDLAPDRGMPIGQQGLSRSEETRFMRFIITGVQERGSRRDERVAEIRVELAEVKRRRSPIPDCGPVVTGMVAVHGAVPDSCRVLTL